MKQIFTWSRVLINVWKIKKTPNLSRHSEIITWRRLINKGYLPVTSHVGARTLQRSTEQGRGMMDEINENLYKISYEKQNKDFDISARLYDVIKVTNFKELLNLSREILEEVQSLPDEEARPANSWVV